MTSFMGTVRSAFRKPSGPPVDVRAREHTQDRKLVQRVATGNIRLQRGEYVTKAELDREYDEVQSYSFDDDK